MLETTQVESQLIDAAQVGELLDVSDASERKVRAVVIRGLLCGWHEAPLDPVAFGFGGLALSGNWT